MQMQILEVDTSLKYVELEIHAVRRIHIISIDMASKVKKRSSTYGPLDSNKDEILFFLSLHLTLRSFLVSKKHVILFSVQSSFIVGWQKLQKHQDFFLKSLLHERKLYILLHKVTQILTFCYLNTHM